MAKAKAEPKSKAKPKFKQLNDSALMAKAKSQH